MADVPGDDPIPTDEEFRARILEEVRQLRGVRALRMRMFGARDPAVAELDRMIRERRRKLYERV